MKGNELIGKEVIDADAKLIGSVKGIDIDVKKWTINGLIIKAGFIKKILVLTTDIDRVGDKVILKVTQDKIQKR
jgi:sporulation protein YlmC with PRC-barrel domain